MINGQHFIYKDEEFLPIAEKNASKMVEEFIKLY